MQLDDVRRVLASPVVRSVIRSPTTRRFVRNTFNRYRRRTPRRALRRFPGLGRPRRMRRRMMQRRQAFSPRNLAFECNVANYYRRFIQGALVSRASRTIAPNHLVELTAIPFGQAPDERDSNVLNLNSVTVRYSVRNDLNIPLCFHMALISPRNNQDPTTINFFRGPSGDRGINFDAITNNSHVFNEYGINTDRYVVLSHKRHWLAEEPNGVGLNTRRYFTTNSRNYVSSKIHKKINRQFRYDSEATAVPSDGRIFIIYWADALLGGALSADPAIPNAFQFQQNSVIRFKNQFNC